MSAYVDRFDSKTPVRNKNGDPYFIRVVAADDLMFERAFANYPFHTYPYLAALAGRSVGYMKNRVRNMKRPPNQWLEVCRPQRERKESHRCSSLAYAPTSRTLERMAERGVITSDGGFSGSFPHMLIACQVRASFDIANNERPGFVIPWREIRDNIDIPDHVKTEGALYTFRVDVGDARNSIERDLRPDMYPFAVETEELGIACLLFEIDLATETIAPTHFKRSAIHTKFAGYLDLLERQKVRDRYGFDKCFILFVTTLNVRVKTMMAELEKMTEKKPSLRKHFGFARHPSIYSDDDPVASSHMAKTEYRRVGYPPLVFLKA